MITPYTTVTGTISFAARPYKILWVLPPIYTRIHRPMNVLVPVGKGLLAHLQFTFPWKQN